MGSNGNTPEVPDLAAGVPADLVPEGGTLTGRLGEETVLLARVGGRCYAVGALCPHYGAPLAEGLVVGDTIRCPWHHAAFCLRTGETLRPPALDDLPCWQVEESAGRVRVAGRIARRSDGPAPRRASGGARGAPAARAPESVVIVGAGAAGIVAADTLRREGYAGPVTIVDGDTDAPVDRPNLSKDYLAGSAPEEWVALRPPACFRDREIELLTGARVASLDLRQRRVLLRGGDERPFGALLLATGASSARLPIATTDRLPIHYLRTLADSRAIIRAADGARRAVVLGASFIGLEVAASLRARGLEVHVVAPHARPLERVLGAALGDLVRALHEAHGVVFHLGARPGSIGPDAVLLESGERLPADLVVAGVGVRPNVALAATSGLAVDDGILVDEYLETEVPGVFAAGDVARWLDARTDERMRVEHWVVAERQGQAAARNILGPAEPFDAVPFFWSAHYDVTIAYVGHATRWDAVEIDGSPERHDCLVRFRAGGRTLAVAAVGRDRAALEAELAMEQAAPAPQAAS